MSETSEPNDNSGRYTLSELTNALLPQLSSKEMQDIGRILQLLVEHFRPERVYLFGSQARREATPESDVDLLIVVPQTTEPVYRLEQEAYQLIGAHAVPLDIIVMPHDEFEWRSHARASLPATVLREGRLLYAA